MKFIFCNCRFDSSDSQEVSKENEKLRDLGIEIEEDTPEIEYEWMAISIRKKEIVAYNAYDEYSTAIRLANTQVFVIDLLFGEVSYSLLPWHKRFFYRNLEIARERLISLKMRVKRFKNNFVF
ncbi:MAG: hypothetical protein Unbinned4388contig1000_77 [Prokaryotic dsDNA virus sp.]|nr:MAG: hypothetical protein Unbinned4388contig1000_77 [Prokaryotic dsDNA virus sp.]